MWMNNNLFPIGPFLYPLKLPMFYHSNSGSKKIYENIHLLSILVELLGHCVPCGGKALAVPTPGGKEHHKVGASTNLILESI